jgi:hypothetical protein
MEEPRTIEYATRSKPIPIIRLYGVLSILFCVLQFPWIGVWAWAYWAILWGDNQPPMGGFVVSYIAAALPSIVAIVLGLTSILRRDTLRFDRITGMVGCLGGIVWSCFVIAAFFEALKSRW